MLSRPDRRRMTSIRYLLAGACLLFLLGESAGASADWQLAAEEEGITVYTREVESSPVKQFKASMKVAANLASVLAVMLDSEACPEWVYRCQDAKILQRNGFGDTYVYRTIDLPWPVSDRDIVMHKMVSQDPETRAITIKNTSAPDFTPRTKLVRIVVSESEYRLEPLEDGGVRVTWTQLSDPAGFIPKALVNSMIVTSPLSTLKNLREMVQKEKYRNARLTHDAQGRLTGFTAR